MARYVFRIGGLMLFLVTSASPAYSEIFAHSINDWATAKANDGIPQQNELGWQYGYYDTIGNPTTFTTDSGPGADAMIWTDPIWLATGNGGGARLGSSYGHPGSYGSQDLKPAVWRYTYQDTVAKLVYVDGYGKRLAALNAGDGVEIQFYRNNTLLASETLVLPAADNGYRFFGFFLDLNHGDTLDMVLGARSNAAYDTTELGMELNAIGLAAPEPVTVSLLGLGGCALLRRRKRSRV